MTVDGLEWSQLATNNSGFGDGYCMGFPRLTLTNYGVDTSTPSVRPGRMWLEDADGVTVNPANTGFSYGEYGLGFDYSFGLYEDGQTVRVAVLFMLREGFTDYIAVVDGVRAPLTFVEGVVPWPSDEKPSPKAPSRHACECAYVERGTLTARVQCQFWSSSKLIGNQTLVLRKMFRVEIGKVNRGPVRSTEEARTSS